LKIVAFPYMTFLQLPARLLGARHRVGLGAGVLPLDALLFGGVVLLCAALPALRAVGNLELAAGTGHYRLPESTHAFALSFAPGHYHVVGLFLV
jgi:hypothetical protein